MDYFLNSEDGIKSTTEYLNLSNILIILAFLIVGIYVLKKIHTLFNSLHSNTTNQLISSLLIVGLLILGIRGGIQKIPINVGSAFYSKNQTHNYFTVNKTYYFVSSLLKNSKNSKLDYSAELEQFYAQLYEKPPTTLSLLSDSTPNIVLIMMEGCPAQVFDSSSGLTPSFTKLSEGGVSFDNLYSSGFRTDQGLLSILSGVPALPYDNMMSNIELANQFPSLFSAYKTQHYFTSFVYGGDINFSSIGNYLAFHKVDKVVSDKDFNNEDNSISWGVPDDIVFNRFQNELTQQQEPFFSAMITQSTHPPFDFSFSPKFTGEDEASKFKSSVYFMDSCLGDFMEKAKRESWYKNTLFVIVSDHGSMYLDDIDFNSHERFRIPLLLFGEPLKKEYQGTHINTIGNSHDLPTTLLSLTSQPSDSYKLGVNLFDSTSNHAYWITEHTMGWITKGQKLVMNHEKKEVYFIENNKDTSSKVDGLMYYNLVKQYVNQ